MTYIVYKIMGGMRFYAGLFHSFDEADAYAWELVFSGYKVVVDEVPA